VVNLRPGIDLPDSDYVAVEQGRVIRVLRRIAYDIEELARSRRVTDLSRRENAADPRMRLRCRMAEPPIEISRRGTSIRQSRQAWEDYESRLRRTGIPILRTPIAISTVQRTERLKPVSGSNTPRTPNLFPVPNPELRIMRSTHGERAFGMGFIEILSALSERCQESQ